MMAAEKSGGMVMRRRVRPMVLVGLAMALTAAWAAPAEAQRSYEPLFDTFNLRLEGSWVALATEIRLDSELLGRGTTLSFEDDLDLDSSKTIPTLAFEWQMGRRHLLGVRWQDISRASSAQALTEIQWGEEIIPIDSAITLGFDIEQIFVDWTYYPWVKDQWAAGFGLGLRVMDLTASLQWRLQGEEELGGAEAADGTGPLPYIYFEYRRLFGEHWRMIAGAGWLEVSFEDIDGGQYVGRLSGEYLLGRHWGFGAAVNLATVDVDWAGLQTEEDMTALSAAIQLDVNDVSIFVRGRF